MSTLSKQRAFKMAEKIILAYEKEKDDTIKQLHDEVQLMIQENPQNSHDIKKFVMMNMIQKIDTIFMCTITDLRHFIKKEIGLCLKFYKDYCLKISMSGKIN